MEDTQSLGSKPIQLKSWNSKIANNKQWFKENVDHYIKLSNFNYNNTTSGKGKLRMLYEVYNNKFPSAWFAHVTDPLSAQNPQHKKFPAKVRPVNILRTNLDLLMAEYPRRPFISQVNNLGEDGYNRYMAELDKKIESNITQFYQLSVQQEAIEQGLIRPDGKPISEEAAAQLQEMLDSIELPEETQESFKSTYRDKVAIKGQRWLKRALREHNIRPKFLKQFKDWLIAGEAYSFKYIQHDNIVYEKISPLNIEYDKSDECDFVEDGEWVCAQRFLTASDIVDRFYEELKETDINRLEHKTLYSTPDSFLSHLVGNTTDESSHKIPVWHVQWKGKKKIGFRTFVDPETMTVVEDQVDEDYVKDPNLDEKIDWRWVNEVYEGWRIMDDLYVGLDALAVQRNAMNNFSTCKLSYNGRKYSDTHAENISVMEIGMPFQIMYIIVTRSLELTIAKSKGKILLIDQNAIPNGEGWDEEKFFYYSEALGYGLLDRNQIGVDKSWNQYQVLDMTLFDSISQLIELQTYFKQQWDDIIGINRQRKGQTYASDLVGVNERATFQSTVITDMIFNLFEEYIEKELQGLLDLSKFTNSSGVRKMWYDSEVGNEILEINPEDYCNAELGVFVESSSEAIAIKNKLEAQVQAMVQNNVKPSTIFQILQTENTAELKAKLLRIEELEAQAVQQSQDAEAQLAEQADERKKKFMEYEKMLDTAYMNAEYDRKEEIEMIRGDFNTFTFKDGDSDANGTPDTLQVEKNRLDRDKFEEEKRTRRTDRADRIAKEQQDLEIKKQELAIKKKAVNKKPSKK